MGFNTQYLKIGALRTDLNGRGLPQVQHALIESLVDSATKDMIDPKASVLVIDSPSTFQCIVNVMPRPGDVWPEDLPPQPTFPV